MNVLVTGGERPGGSTEIESLVGVLVTAEPWDGHTSPDPISHDSGSMAEDESADVAVRLFGSNIVGAYSSIKIGVFKAWGGKTRGQSNVPSSTTDVCKTSSAIASVATNLKKEGGSETSSISRVTSFENFLNEKPDLV